MSQLDTRSTRYSQNVGDEFMHGTRVNVQYTIQPSYFYVFFSLGPYTLPLRLVTKDYQ